jgi:hypothetical protein
MVHRWRLLPEHVDAGPGERAIAQPWHGGALRNPVCDRKGQAAWIFTLS